MATIDYKEKYEQALERARQFFEKPYLEDSAGIVGYIFPELKESEDERIRKALKEYFINSFQNNGVAAILGVHIKDILSWLEKQSDKDKFIEKELGCIKGYRENAIKRLEELEKQGKQKSEEEEVDNLHNYLYGEQKPTEWKQENVEELSEFENAMMHIGGSFFGQHAGLNPNNTNAIKEQAEYLLELAQNPAWSEEDERMYQSIMDDTVQENQLDDKQTEWLRDIKERNFAQPQSQWKPSDEQIEALDFAADCIVPDEFCFKRKVLKELLEQLKKLKE